MKRSKRIKEGNQCLFYTFIIFNFMEFLQAIGLLGVGIYLLIFTEEANEFNVGFMAIAVILMITSFVAFRFRKHLELLGAYVAFLGIVFLA